MFSPRSFIILGLFFTFIYLLAVLGLCCCVGIFLWLQRAEAAV